MLQKNKNIEIQEVEQVQEVEALEQNALDDHLEQDLEVIKLETVEQIASTPLENQDISNLKFPTEHSEQASQSKSEVINSEKSLNNASNTALKMGFKGVVALNKVQQQLEDISSARAVKLNTINSQSQQVDPYSNLLSILNLFGLSRMKKGFNKLFKRYSSKFGKKFAKGFESSKLKKLVKKLSRRVKQSQTDS